MRALQMILPAAMGLGALLCFSLDARLDASAREDRAAQHRLGSLVPVEIRDELVVAGLGLSRGVERYLYTRRDGVWRCNWRGALVDEQAVSALVKELLVASGPLDPLPEDSAELWGFGTEDEWRLDVLGPDLARRDDGDVRLALRFGNELPSIGGCFAQLVGEDGVRTLDVNPIARLRSAPGTPPLLDPTLLGRAQFARGVQITDVLVEYAERPTLRLQERPSGASAEDQRRGASPYIHVLIDEPAEPRFTVAGLVGSLFVFLQTAEWEEVLAPDELAGVGLDVPEGRVLLGRNSGEPVQLMIGPLLPDGRCAVLNTDTGLGFLVSKEVAQALRFAAEDLLPGAAINPWDAWLNAGSGAPPPR